MAVQLYGEENPFLVESLKARLATVLEIPLYASPPLLPSMPD